MNRLADGDGDVVGHEDAAHAVNDAAAGVTVPLAQSYIIAPIEDQALQGLANCRNIGFIDLPKPHVVHKSREHPAGAMGIDPFL